MAIDRSDVQPAALRQKPAGPLSADVLLHHCLRRHMDRLVAFCTLAGRRGFIAVSESGELYADHVSRPGFRADFGGVCYDRHCRRKTGPASFPPSTHRMARWNTLVCLRLDWNSGNHDARHDRPSRNFTLVQAVRASAVRTAPLLDLLYLSRFAHWGTA